ncbi:MAG TPA: carboxypeptidase-like regulatory domain-containing protein [Bacteroidales bacterium]|nr:carboxypeptidase-like regulatory domain-containing protein [Bacteroidales bacterium]
MKRIVFTIILVFSVVSGYSQAEAIIGSVTDHETGEPLVGVKIVHVTSGEKAITDFDGNFEFNSVSSGVNKLKISYISYEDIKLNRVVIDEGTQVELNIKLRKKGALEKTNHYMAVRPDPSPRS